MVFMEKKVRLLTCDLLVILHLLPPTVMINLNRSLLFSTSRYLPLTNNTNFEEIILAINGLYALPTV